MKKLIKEPLFAFLLLSGIFFLVFQVGGNRSDTEELEEIYISNAQVEVLISGFEKVWQRLPSQQELNGLVQEFIREEILYREALKMGLDQEDAIVRRRLRQKMEFISEDIASLREATNEDLQNYLDNNPDRFRSPDRYTFSQVYLNSSQRGSAVYTDAEFLLAELQGGADIENVESLGDQLMMMENHYDQIDDREISRILGSQFMLNIAELPPGSWQGPIESGFGLHLVKVEERIPGAVPSIGEIRMQVESEWMSEQRSLTNEAFYTALKDRYTVVLEDIRDSGVMAAEASN